MSLTGNGSPGTASELLDLNYGSGELAVDRGDIISLSSPSSIHPHYLGIRYMNMRITFDEEVAFLKKSKWNTVKIFYLVCRYLPFLFLATNTTRFLQPGLSLKACKSYFQFNSFAGAIIIACAELMFLVRTYALWGRTRLVLAIILVNSMAFFIPNIVIIALFSLATTFTPVPESQAAIMLRRVVSLSGLMFFL
ncbi:hypothetical protein BU15DRAFT_81507 [Melanogaster broomeanus]|nr:hypothetical protein BU15DRAFT_81507 [Melanogaster broomeanus]